MGNQTAHRSPDSSAQVRVLVVDDHPLIRAGLEKMLNLEDDIVVVGYGVDGKQALKLAREFTPDVMLLDVNLPGPDGYQVTRRLKVEQPELAIVILTAYHDKYQELYAIRVGASAYCSKDIRPEDLAAVIRDTASGQYVINGRRMDRRSVDAWIRKNVDNIAGSNVDDSEKRLIPLSSRESEILKSMARGMSNKDIATKLGISQQTVKNHVTSILRKLNVGDRTQAVVTAIRHGWVRIQENDASN